MVDDLTLQKARNLAKDVFSEPGPDGPEGLFAFLEASANAGGRASPATRPWPIRGSYPGMHGITSGLNLIKELLGDCEPLGVSRAVCRASSRAAGPVGGVSRHRQFFPEPEADLGKAPRRV